MLTVYPALNVLISALNPWASWLSPGNDGIGDGCHHDLVDLWAALLSDKTVIIPERSGGDLDRLDKCRRKHEPSGPWLGKHSAAYDGRVLDRATWVRKHQKTSPWE
jgi:hypothetical protein